MFSPPSARRKRYLRTFGPSWPSSISRSNLQVSQLVRIVSPKNAIAITPSTQRDSNACLPINARNAIIAAPHLPARGRRRRRPPLPFPLRLRHPPPPAHRDSG